MFLATHKGPWEVYLSTGGLIPMESHQKIVKEDLESILIKGKMRQELFQFQHM
jgi:hypothetical protein